MALNKKLLLLFATLLALSLAHSTLVAGSYTPNYSEDEEEEAPKYKKVHGYGGRKVYKKGHFLGYSGHDGDDEEDDDTGYYGHDDGPKRPVYKKPVYKKPYVKKPVYKPAAKPYYKPKPKYKLPVVEKPAYTEPEYDDTDPDTEVDVYEKPAEKPEPEEEEEEPKPSYRKPYYKRPAEGQHEPEKPVPEKPSPSSSSSSEGGEWLAPHNAARAEVGLPPLVWSEEVARYAENWASQRQAAGCGLQHSGGSYGENIFWGSGGGYGPAECVAAWVGEKNNYNYADNSCSSGDCGHYTQIIWAKSVRLGCAKAQCGDGSVFMTCNYDPPGNYIGTKPF
ncbi:hypothetical protein L7F22_010090 [Adiantum nelumboides]|nr:hypothetical protein [Adiantum nelumboides]